MYTNSLSERNMNQEKSNQQNLGILLLNSDKSYFIMWNFVIYQYHFINTEPIFLNYNNPIYI